MRSRLSPEVAAAVFAMMRDGLRLNEIAARVEVDRRTILRWVERDEAFRQGYAAARRDAHRGLYDELRAVIGQTEGARRKLAYAARRRIMARTPKRHGRLPADERPDVLGELDRRRVAALRLFRLMALLSREDP